MKFKVYAHYLYGLIKPFAADDDISVTAVFPVPYLCHVIDNQPVNRQ